MKTSIRKLASIATAILFFLGGSSAAAEKAPVQFISLSIIIAPGTADDPLTDLPWTLSLSSVGDEHAMNNELMLSDSDYSHEGYFVLEDYFETGTIFPFVLNIPPYTDANKDGIEDFFDMNMSVDGVETSGLHPDDSGGAEEFTAIWYRTAGDLFGGVTFDFPYFGLRFDHTFYLSHFSGAFTYERTGSNLQGSLALTNLSNADDYITGPLSVRVVNPTTLDITATAWTSSLGQQMVIIEDFYDNLYKTNFVSFWLVEDGFFLTSQPDYLDWFMVINSGDADGDGVLDLVDTGTTPVERPTLGIARTTAGYEISIAGTSGKTYWLEYTSQVTDAAWPNHHVVTLTGPTQTMTVPADATGDVFFRLREI
ncbi:MAG: hypothetical protein ACXW3Z_05455 [Limisphaerales bacterium]